MKEDTSLNDTIDLDNLWMQNVRFLENLYATQARRNNSFPRLRYPQLVNCSSFTNIRSKVLFPFNKEEGFFWQCHSCRHGSVNDGEDEKIVVWEKNWIRYKGK